MKKEYQSILAIVLGLIGAHLLWNTPYTLQIAFGVVLIALISEKATKGLHFIWEKIGSILGFIMPKLLLSFIYFLILTPMAFLFRISSIKSTAFHPKNKELPSTFKQTQKEFKPTDFEKMF